MIYDLIIIGGGPAGVSAGIYAVRQKLRVLLITKNFGGQLSRKAGLIENYPGLEKISGSDLIQKFENHLKIFSAKDNFAQKGEIEIHEQSVMKIEKKEDVFTVISKNKNQFQANSVIICSGADPRSLGITGEREYVGKGVSFCAVCDGPMYKDKNVAVVGGGNSGFEAAFDLSKWAKKVYILESASKIKACNVLQKKVEEDDKIKVMKNISIKEIKGDKLVNALVYENLKTKKIETLDVKGVFIEIGSQPADFFANDLVKFNEKKEIEINSETCQTITPGLFAAGDVTNTTFKQIIIAAGAGARAALFSYRYLKIGNKKKDKVNIF